MTTLAVLNGGADDVPEPDWAFLIPNRDDKAHEGMRALAHEEWMRVTRALRDAGTLGPANGRQVRRLVLAYVRYDVAAVQVMSYGAVVGSSKTNVPQLSLWQVEMRAADGDATTLEMELCLTPRRRGSATKVEKKRRAAAASDSYLGRSGTGG